MIPVITVEDDLTSLKRHTDVIPVKENGCRLALKASTILHILALLLAIDLALGLTSPFPYVCGFEAEAESGPGLTLPLAIWGLILLNQVFILLLVLQPS